MVQQLDMIPHAETERKKWPPETAGTVGLECRACGCRHFFTDHTRKMNHMIIRYRRCRHCGRRMTTCERPISADD